MAPFRWRWTLTGCSGSRSKVPCLPCQRRHRLGHPRQVLPPVWNSGQLTAKVSSLYPLSYFKSLISQAVYACHACRSLRSHPAWAEFTESRSDEACSQLPLSWDEMLGSRRSFSMCGIYRSYGALHQTNPFDNNVSKTVLYLLFISISL